MLRRLLIAVTFLAFGCRRAPVHPPVIIISIDTLRADRVGAQTPNINSLAHDGISCEAWSHVPLTLPSHLTILTGLLPPEHGVRDNAGYRFDPHAHPTLASTLRANGYRTGAAVSAYVLRGSTGISSGFETYDDAIGIVDGAPLAALRRDGGETEQIAEHWIAAHAREPFFFFLHLYEPHAPYAPTYDASVAKADAIAGSFVDFLKAQKLYDGALIVLLSDHGEGLGQHGEAEHGVFVYRESLAVPLIVKLPGGERRSVAQRVQLADVTPTILDVLHLGGPQPHSIFTAGERAIYSESLYPRIHFGWSELRSLVRGDHHYIDAPRPELYDLARDPRESHNAMSDDRRAVSALRGELAKIDGAFVAPSAIESEEKKKLAALGYVSAGADVSGPLPDPKDRIADAVRLEHALHTHSIAEMQSLLAANPRWSDLRDELASAYMSTEDFKKAAAVEEEGIAITPSLASRFALTAGYARLQAYDFAGAERDAQVAVAVEPGAHLLLGEIALARGDAPAAEREAAIAERTAGERGHALFLEAKVAWMRRDFARSRGLIDASEAECARTHASLPEHFHYLRADTLAHLGDLAAAQTEFHKNILAEPRFQPAYRDLALVEMIQRGSSGNPRRSH
jgi:choline-sulfatase